MLRLAFAVSLLLSFIPSLSKAAEGSASEWKVQKTFPVSGEGRWDFLTVDPAAHRLYIPRSTHTQVLDTHSGKVIADWPDTSGVHGVALVPGKNLAFTSNGKSNTASVFDLKSNAKLADVKTGDGPDAIIYDDASAKVIAFNHKGGSVTFISPADKEFTPHDLQVGGALEVGVSDGAGHVFVNVEDKNEVVEIDAKAATVLHHYPIAGGEGPTGLAIDPKNHRLFIGCGGNDKLAVMDSTNGSIIAMLPIGPRCDGCAFDPATGEAFASCGDSTLAVAKQGSDGKFTITQMVQTKPGARTIALDPVSHLIYLPSAEFEPAVTGQRPVAKPGTFQIVVVGR